VNISVAKVRLFVGNIPKQRTKDEIMAEFSKISGEQKDFANYAVFIIIWLKFKCIFICNLLGGIMFTQLARVS